MPEISAPTRDRSRPKPRSKPHHEPLTPALERPAQRPTGSGAQRPGPRLIGLATALPDHVVDQREARAFAAETFGGAFGSSTRLLDVYDHSGIDTRRVCMPLEWYREPHDFGERNRLYIEHGLALARRASEPALERAGLGPGDIDHVVFVSSTGLATPSLDARLAQVLGLREDIHRTPVWGLGCAGGAAGVARARDFALADPGARVLLVALELCSLSFQRRDLDRRSLVAAALFSDGAAAAVVAGPEASGSGARVVGAGEERVAGTGGARALELLASQSTLWPDSLDVMGWEVDGDGLHVVFSRDIPSIVTEHVRGNLERFLSAHGLSLAEVTHLVAHPGGPRVLEAYASALGLAPEAFVHAREVLRACGNMSSPTCLFVLERLLDHGVAPGDLAVLAALGPGFASEYVLMRAAM